MDKKILLVEDDEFLRELYLDSLKSAGYSNIDSAIDGEEALQKMQLGGWDLVLLDIVLPKMNGIDVIKKIKSSNPNVKFTNCLIFLTNLDSGQEIKEALLLGDGYLIKSQITPGDLVNEVKLYLERPTAPPTN